MNKLFIEIFAPNPSLAPFAFLPFLVALVITKYMTVDGTLRVLAQIVCVRVSYSI